MVKVWDQYVFIYQWILKKCITVSAQIWSGTTVFNTDNNMKYFLSSKSAYIRMISEGSCMEARFRHWIQNVKVIDINSQLWDINSQIWEIKSELRCSGPCALNLPWAPQNHVQWGVGGGIWVAIVTCQITKIKQFKENILTSNWINYVKLLSNDFSWIID